MLFKSLGENLKNGNNIFTCDGKSLCFSGEFIKSLKFPKDLNYMGNVDYFLYLECIRNKFKYRYAKDAILYFKYPSTITDFTKWQIRNYTNNNYVLSKTFGNLVKKEYNVPFFRFTYYRIIEFIKNPIGSIFIKLVGYYCYFKSYQQRNIFNKTWETVLSTKEI